MSYFFLSLTLHYIFALSLTRQMLTQVPLYSVQGGGGVGHLLILGVHLVLADKGLPVQCIGEEGELITC